MKDPRQLGLADHLLNSRRKQRKIYECFGFSAPAMILIFREGRKYSARRYGWYYGVLEKPDRGQILSKKRTN